MRPVFLYNSTYLYTGFEGQWNENVRQVIASGTSPVIMSVLIDHQVTLRLQAMLCLIYIVSASLLATRIKVDVPDTNL